MGASGGRVDIGTEWNLECDTGWGVAIDSAVDIGTEWNLEGIQKRYQEAKKG